MDTHEPPRRETESESGPRRWGDGAGSAGGSGGGAAFGPGGGGRGRPHEKWSGRKRFLVWSSSVLAGVIVLGASTFTLVWNHLNGNIKTEWANLKPSPMNGKQDVLFIGSDSRAGANQALGGGSVAGARSDTTMVFDSPADRREGTEVSIPRDSMVQIPTCTNASGQTVAATFGMFNSAFTSGGAPCTVRTVQSLTGLPLTHYIVVDFEGVVGVVDALGGVKVCVTQPIKDRDSGLDLPAGTTTLNGQQALAFVRVRHALGDGSDLERIQRQQYFIDQLTAQVRAAGLLTDPVKLYKVLNAATSAIQADPGLGTVSDLYGLAQTLNSIPSGKMTYVTVPNKPFPDNPDRVVWSEPAAGKLWNGLINESDAPNSTSGTSAVGLRPALGGHGIVGLGGRGPVLYGPAVPAPAVRAAVPGPSDAPPALRANVGAPVYGPVRTPMSDVEAFLGAAPTTAADATSPAAAADVRAAESLGAFESLMRLALMADTPNGSSGSSGASPSAAPEAPSDPSTGSAVGTTTPGGVDTCPVT